ncbi:hypothetical protein FXO38_29430 [Capsicum annuum]|nr:hypothetical protein FXO38_29430 [Capsicum annuum]
MLRIGPDFVESVDDDVPTDEEHRYRDSDMKSDEEDQSDDEGADDDSDDMDGTPEDMTATVKNHEELCAFGYNEDMEGLKEGKGVK